MSEFQKVLTPVDFSGVTDEVIRLALTIAEQYGAQLRLLHVRDALLAGDSNCLPVAPANLGLPAPEPTEPRLESLAESLASRTSVPVETRCILGAASSAIVEMAKEMPADLIVIGTHGRTGFRHLIMGSVAERVLRDAPCPVLTVRGGGGAFAGRPDWALAGVVS